MELRVLCNDILLFREGVWWMFLMQEEFRPAHPRRVAVQLEPGGGRKGGSRNWKNMDGSVSHTSHYTSSLCVYGVCACVSLL